MKKTIIALGITLLAGVTGYAQNNTAKKGPSYMSLGPVAGFGHSWVSELKGMEFKPSAHLGINMIYSKMEHWGWGMLTTISHEGYTQEYMQAGNLYNYTSDPTYLRMVPRAYYFFGPYTSNIRPKIYAGPSVGVKLIEDTYVKNETMNQSDVTMGKSGGPEMYKTFDLGGELGAGVNVKIAPRTWLNLDANYYRGFMDVTKSDVVNFGNRNMRLNVGVMMGL